MTTSAFFSWQTLRRWAAINTLLLHAAWASVPLSTASVQAQLDWPSATTALDQAYSKSATAQAKASYAQWEDSSQTQQLTHAALPQETAAAPAELPVDEKYRLTGDAALELEPEQELERGKASWYGSRFHGRATASGETYDKYELTAAHKTLPFGTVVRVRSVKLGREVDVRINDRGPFAPGRVIDVSEAAARALGLVGAGVLEVSLNVADAAFQEALDSVKAIPAKTPKAIKVAKRTKTSKMAKASNTSKAAKKPTSAKAVKANATKPPLTAKPPSN